MKERIILRALLINMLFFICNSAALDGVVICNHLLGIPEENYMELNSTGIIDRHILVNNKVVASTTIKTDPVCRAPILSKDGKMVAFFRSDDKVCIMDINGENEVALTSVTHTGRTMDWPDGDWIFYVGENNEEIWKVNVQTKEAVLVANFGRGMNTVL